MSDTMKSAGAEPGKQIGVPRPRANGTRRRLKKPRAPLDAGPKAQPPKKARSFPAATFEESLAIAQAIQTYGAGQKMRRLTIFEKLGKSPESGPSRQMVTNSSKYGLTVGGYQSEHLDLTPDGRLATGGEMDPSEQLKARFRLAIEAIQPFKKLYEQYKGGKLPSQQVMRDFLGDAGLRTEEAPECVETFTLNARFLGLLRTVAGAERLLPLEHVLEELPRKNGASLAAKDRAVRSASQGAATDHDWKKVCFFIAPIGEEDSEQRKHSDLFLGSIIEPALDEFGMKVVRADQIGRAGMITGQVIEHIVKAGLVIADLSFHNPSVFYELCLRHACRKPTVQLIRSSERIPFDVDQVRTVKIDTSSIYALVPRLESLRAEVASQVRKALADPDAVDNPITTFFPDLRVTIGNGAGG